MMEILHLLPAALETLFSVYWLSACDFCTVDVNITKKDKPQESRRNKRPVHTRENVAPTNKNEKLYFFSLSNQHRTRLPCNDVTMKLLMSPGPNHTSSLLLHQLLPTFPVVPGDLIGWTLSTMALDIYCDLKFVSD